MAMLERLAPVGDYKHHQTGEDNGDAHLKRMLVKPPESRPPITKGAARSRSMGTGFLRGV